MTQAITHPHGLQPPPVVPGLREKRGQSDEERHRCLSPLPSPVVAIKRLAITLTSLLATTWCCFPVEAALFRAVEPSSFANGTPLTTNTEQGGLVFADLDNDGDDDLVVLRDTSTAPLILRNDTSVGGSPSFREEPGVLNGSLINGVVRYPSGLIVSADIDNDGDVDLFATDDGSGLGTWLWRNNLIDAGLGTPSVEDAFSFTLIGASSGFSSAPTRTVGATFLDIDADGDLDLAIDTPNSTRRLYLNRLEQDIQSFELASVNQNPDNYSNGHDLTALDLNLDGDIDLTGRATAALNNSYDVVYMNDSGRLIDGNGSSVAFSVPATWLNPGTGVSSAWADYDNDGDYDALIQNSGATSNGVTYTTRFFVTTWTASGGIPFSLNDRSPTGELGVSFPTAFNTADGGGGVQFADLNNDGRLDVLFGHPSSVESDRLYLGQGTSTPSRPWQFTDATANETALTSRSQGDTEAVALVDFDLDGDLDAYLQQDGTAPAILLNDTSTTASSKNYLKVRVTCAQRDCFGATVQVFTGGDADGDGIPEAFIPGFPGGIPFNGRDYGLLTNAVAPGSLIGMQQVSGGNGIGAQSSPLLHFGLPTKNTSDTTSPAALYYTVRVVFPGGKVIFRDVQPSTTQGKWNGRTLAQLLVVDQNSASDDGDGLPASLEQSLGSSNLDLDSDDDGLMDATERWKLLTHPANPDSDGDGLPDNLELAITTTLPDLDGNGALKGTDLSRCALDADTSSKSDPLKADSDGDGLSDGVEDKNHNGRYDASSSGNAQETHPGDLDSDDDGLTDGAEVVGYIPPTVTPIRTYYANPRSADSDSDGLLDGLEVGLLAPQASPTLENILGTNVAQGAFQADSVDQGTRVTDPLKKDTDGDGLSDGIEDYNRNGNWDGNSPYSETDATLLSTDAGCDSDGLELTVGTNPLEQSDDSCSDPDADGCTNAQENSAGTNPRVADTDKDNILDCTELSTGTSPLSSDSDKDGIGDGVEDLNRDGIKNVQESDPRKKDTDGDSLSDGVEDFNRNGKQDSNESSALDRDTDDDGLADNQEDNNLNGLMDSGETSALKSDTDGDALSDGLEAGIVSPNPDTNLNTGAFTSDADPSVLTSPLIADTDNDALKDGTEDLNHNGRVDNGETDPNRADTDGDGLSDGQEMLTYHTNPLKLDTDADGLDDGYELSHGLDPGAVDSDLDGLTDGQEVQQLLTDPLKADTDLDGLSDGLEQTLGTDARLADTDQDGLKDGIEVNHPTEPTNPLSQDTDQDGVLDLVETASTCALNAADADSDRDGLSDGEEDFVNKNCTVEAVYGETNPLDDDSDDDGLCDGNERRTLLTAPSDADSDDDGLQDGTELGLARSQCTATHPSLFIADQDPSSQTSPLLADTDQDGLIDGSEDKNRNGIRSLEETDPTLLDTDLDGLSDGDELNRYGTSPLLADTDGGCQDDASELSAGLDPINTPTDDLCADADADGIANDLERRLFRSNPLDADTDDDGVLDGAEPGLVDLDADGLMDGWIDSLQGVVALESVEYSDVISTPWRIEPGDADLDGLNALLDPDSDNDGILDGTELGIWTANAVTNPDGSVPTRIERRHFVPDADQGASTTLPLSPDTDRGGARDGAEDPNHNGKIDENELDPTQADDDAAGRPEDASCGQGSRLQDSDCDGLTDLEEQLLNPSKAVWLDPLDADSDDDGILDGQEDNPTLDTDLDGLLNAIDPDSDNDGLVDGLERSVSTASVATAVSRGNFVADADPSSSTSMVNPDSDFGGARDGAEDPDHNGRRDSTQLEGVPTEADPDPRNPLDDLSTVEVNPSGCNVDTFFSDLDCDGLTDLEEASLGTQSLDADSDDDGLKDGSEDNLTLDGDQDGKIGAADCDADGDGIADGTERGITQRVPGTTTGTDPLSPCFRSDDDPTTQTSMVNADSDGGLALDGEEDLNFNGKVDGNGVDQEGDPLDPIDDCADSDHDAVCNDAEAAAGTDPYDADSDDDGLLDSEEGLPRSAWDDDDDGDGQLNALDADSDNDGVLDGTERGLTSEGFDGDGLSPDTDLSRGHFREDLDPSSTTFPTVADSDDDGIPDGAEDANADGNPFNDPAMGPVTPCGDPSILQEDTDCDGLSDAQESHFGLPSRDADADDDGVLDGDEDNWRLDSDGDGTLNALDADADNDGLLDGLERGLTLERLVIDTGTNPMGGTRLDVGHFVADQDPLTSTYMILADSDADGFDDGHEDCNRNGANDCIESGPMDAQDPRPGTTLDICTDSDQDGLSDALESGLGTDPDQGDSDGDTLSDPIETDGQTCEPVATDTDLDGHIDALDEDSDNDGIPDLEEAGTGASPKDSDADGVPDYRDWNDPNITPTPAPEVNPCADMDNPECTLSCGCSQTGARPPAGGSFALLLLGVTGCAVRRRVLGRGFPLHRHPR